jgi:hypothetical protein
MPFQQFNYAALQPQNDRPDLVGQFMEGYKASQIPAQLRQSMQEKELANALNQTKVQNAPTDERLKQALMQAQTQKLQRSSQNLFGEDYNLQGPARQAWDLELLKQKVGKDSPIYKDAKKQYDLQAINRGFGGAGMKEQNYLQSIVQKDYPDFTPEQAYEATNVYMNGGDTLSDGTKLNPPSPTFTASLDRLTKYGTTSPIITQAIQTEQAKAAIPVMQDYALKGMAPYGDTIFNVSPDQLIDTTKKDKESQIRLGRAIAAKQLSFDLAQEYIRLSRARPGVTITNELMELGQNNINYMYPKLSQIAREESMRYLFEALNKANEQMLKVPIGASNAYTKKENQGVKESEKPTKVYQWDEKLGRSVEVTNP